MLASAFGKGFGKSVEHDQGVIVYPATPLFLEGEKLKCDELIYFYKGIARQKLQPK